MPWSPFTHGVTTFRVSRFFFLQPIIKDRPKNISLIVILAESKQHLAFHVTNTDIFIYTVILLKLYIVFVQKKMAIGSLRFVINGYLKGITNR